ncbi:aldose epimerase family protein [Oceanobacillus bengalensis]|uniref:Aldose 1-epimerase n=1 Tax=Oceanobacillus bengalensis TaxID=1435466 RepID=A0A494YZT2_9BACI|nr:aldose epimerase family protein [Oceanobacillus bengalensis]RKQ15674.1 galactose mutarotase [Oceanobacillus bengalensis]
MKIDIKEVKPTNDQVWKKATLMNDHGMTVSLLNYGGIITEILVPDKDGKTENVVLAYKNLEQYLTNPGYLGAIVGRVAGRIPGAAFELNGKTYQLESNEDEHCLHGGANGFNHALWEIEPKALSDEVMVKLIHKSADGEGGFPGNVEAEVTYTLNNQNQLIINYTAYTDQMTPLTLTNHTYFNLSGDTKSTINRHEVTMDSEQFVELDEELIPTGKLLNVQGTTFDFRNGRRLEDGFNDDFIQNQVAGCGYDHYFIFANEKEEKAIVKDENSGRKLTIKTNQPGVVMYTSNNLVEGLELTEGVTKKYLGLCLETQGSPASLHHKGFPNIIREEGEVNKTQTIFSFGVESNDE